MRIRLKVHIDENGDDWVACGISKLGDGILVMLMHDLRPAVLRPMTIDEWNRLEHHWFVDHGMADKPPTRFHIGAKP